MATSEKRMEYAMEQWRTVLGIQNVEFKDKPQNFGSDEGESERFQWMMLLRDFQIQQFMSLKELILRDQLPVVQ